VPQLALADAAPAVERRSVSARGLLDLRAESRRWITAHALERWLVESGFAEPNGEPGRLVPTQRAFEIVGLLDFLGDP
jgi:hypothetical protein